MYMHFLPQNAMFGFMHLVTGEDLLSPVIQSY